MFLLTTTDYKSFLFRPTTESGLQKTGLAMPWQMVNGLTPEMAAIQHNNQTPWMRYI